MPENPKRNKDFENDAETKIDKLPLKQSEDNAKDNWSADQQEKSYYYDDAYGYEIYNPDEEDED